MLRKRNQNRTTNYKAIFQLGNIFLMEKDYLMAINLFDKALKIKPDFWQAINNKGLAYFEKDNINLSIKLLKSNLNTRKCRTITWTCLLYEN